ncbi:MAG: ribosome silencing factor [Alphaproteobacteria bacterium]
MLANEKAKPLNGGAKSKSKPSLLKTIMTSLEDDKAIDISVIELAGKSPIADHMIVASGGSQRHVGAIADHLLTKLKEEGFGKKTAEGMGHSDWVLIDAADAIVHIFRPEVRAYYQLEKMWSADLNTDD